MAHTVMEEYYDTIQRPLVDVRIELRGVAEEKGEGAAAASEVWGSVGSGAGAKDSEPEAPVRTSIVAHAYENTLELHRYVFDDRRNALESALAEHKYNVDSKDRFGNTPLILAAMLGRVECVDLLLDSGADAKVKNNEHWTALEEARSYGNTHIVRKIWGHTKLQIQSALEFRSKYLRDSVANLPDMYIELDWRFRSWIPMVTSFCPHDKIKMWKKGSCVRVEATLIGLDSWTWKRSNISFIFNFRRGKQFSALLLNDDCKVYMNIRKGEKNEASEKKEWDQILELEVADLRSMPIQCVIPPKHITFKRATSGYIWSSDKVDVVGKYETRVFKIKNLEIRKKVRLEHMSEKEIKEYRKAGESIKNVTSQFEEIEQRGATEEQDEQKIQLLGKEGETSEDSDQTMELDKFLGEPVVQKPDLKPPPTPTDNQRYMYLNGSSDTTTTPIGLGRERKEECSSQRFKPEVHMTDDYPVTMPMIITLLKLVAPHHPPVKKLVEFLTRKLPEGFPVKLNIPVFPTISADIVFGECKIGSNQVPDRLFQLPKGYRRGTIEDILLLDKHQQQKQH